MRAWNIALSVVLASLLGCSTLSGTDARPLEPEAVTRDKIARVSGRLSVDQKLYVLRAHDYGRSDLISPRVVQYVVRRGEGNTVRELASFLKNRTDAIAVLGEGDDASVAATILGAIGKLGEQEEVTPQGSLYYIGDARHIPKLTEKAAAIGLSFTAIAYP